MSGKREYFEDFINGLFDIELDIVKNCKPKLHESEQALFDEIYRLRTEGKDYEDNNAFDKRIKNRLKNKISGFLDSLDLLNNDRMIRKSLAEELSFANLGASKKLLRKLIRRDTAIESIHSFLVVFDELRDFFYKIREQNETKTYYEQLEDRLEFINYNLGASYFIRELDLDSSRPDSLNLIEKNLRRINDFIDNPKLIDGYRFELSRRLCQHKINTGEWEEARTVGLIIKDQISHGKMYSRQNLSNLYSLLIRIFSQTYEESKYQYYLSELEKSDATSDFLEKQILNISIQLSESPGSVSNETLAQMEKMVSESKSERLNTFIRLARTDNHIQNGEYNKAKSYNDIFFVDIHNTQVREFLDRIYVQRFLILHYRNQFEDIISLFENKITQRRFLAIERKGQILIYPYVIYDIARCKQQLTDKKEAFRNIYRILDFYHYNNYLHCYSIISDCAKIALESIQFDEEDRIKLLQLQKIVKDTLSLS